MEDILKRMAFMRSRKGCIVKMSDFNPKLFVMVRQYRGMTRKELSKQCGLGIQEIRRIEKKITIFDLQIIKTLIEVLNFPEEFFKTKKDPLVMKRKYGHFYVEEN